MKKLIAIISVLAAGFVGTAKADITMSAGSNLEMQSIGSASNLSIGGSLGFAFSQDLGNGITVTMSGLSFGNDVSVVDNIATTSTGTALATSTVAGTTIQTTSANGNNTAQTNTAAVVNAALTQTTGSFTTDAAVDAVRYCCCTPAATAVRCCYYCCCCCSCHHCGYGCCTHDTFLWILF